jgi:hypothetical protein
MSCPSATLCVGVDGSGDVLTTTTPTIASSWSIASVDGGENSFDAIDCPSAQLCVAVDDSGNVVTSTNPTGGASAWTPADVNGFNTFSGISCPSTTLCVAVDVQGDVVTSTNPAGGTSAWNTATDVDTNANSQSLTSVSCPSTTLCVAVDAGGDVLTASNPAGGASAWAATAVTPTDATLGTEFTAVACPTTTYCLAGDADGDVYQSSAPAGGAAAWVPQTQDAYPIDAISCFATSSCVMVDGWGGVLFAITPQSSSGGGSGGTPGGGSGSGGSPGGGSPGTGAGSGSGSPSKPTTVGKVTVKHGKTVEVTVRCKLAAHHTCAVVATLSLTEKLLRGRIVSITATPPKAARKHASEFRTVVLGKTRKKVQGGKQAVVSVTLTAAAERLLKQRHTLPALLNVQQTSPRKLLLDKHVELRS